jgi:hypothetical protein
MRESGLSKEDIRRDADAVIERVMRAATKPVNETPEVFQLKRKLANMRQLLKTARREIARLSDVNYQIAEDLRKVRFAVHPAQVMMSKRLHREILFHLHPDRWEGNEAKQRAEKCLAEFNGLKAWLYERELSR